MRDSERWIVAFQLVILAAIAVLLCAVGELLIRARPRVFYVHAGGRGEVDPDPMAEPIPIRQGRDARGPRREQPDKPAA